MLKLLKYIKWCLPIWRQGHTQFWTSLLQGIEQSASSLCFLLPPKICVSVNELQNSSEYDSVQKLLSVLYCEVEFSIWCNRMCTYDSHQITYKPFCIFIWSIRATVNTHRLLVADVKSQKQWMVEWEWWAKENSWSDDQYWLEFRTNTFHSMNQVQCHEFILLETCAYPKIWFWSS
jgi:hypothetical protein